MILSILSITDPAVSGAIHWWVCPSFASVTTAARHAELARDRTPKRAPGNDVREPFQCGVRFLDFQHLACNGRVPIGSERSLRPEVRLMPCLQFHTIWLHSAPTSRAVIWLIRAIPCPEASVARSTCWYVAITYWATIDPARWWRSPTPDRWTPVIPRRWASPVRTWRWCTPTRGWWSEGIGRTGWQSQRAKCGKDQCYGDYVDEFHDHNSCRKREGR